MKSGPVGQSATYIGGHNWGHSLQILVWKFCTSHKNDLTNPRSAVFGCPYVTDVLQGDNTGVMAASEIPPQMANFESFYRAAFYFFLAAEICTLCTLLFCVKF